MVSKQQKELHAIFPIKLGIIYNCFHYAIYI